MIDILASFINELRESGVPVSMVETLDAAAALDHIDLGDRSALRATLGATLVKNARHYAIFQTAFDVFFGIAVPADGSEAADKRRTAARAAVAAAGGPGGDPDAGSDLRDLLMSAMAEHDEALIEAIIRHAVETMSGMEPGRPVGGTYYVYRVLRQLDLDGLRERLLAEVPERPTVNRRLALDDIEALIEQVRRRVREEVQRRLVADRGREAVAATLRVPLVEDVDLATATREQLAEVERVVHPLTRKLASRLAARRRRGRTGRLDIRRTMRNSLSTGGVPISPAFKAPRVSKPEIVLLCDISGSVATFARFTMQFVYAVSSQLSRVRSFAFIDDLDEVTRFFGPGEDFAGSLTRLGSEARVVWVDGHSDYGHSFGRFRDDFMEAISPRTIVLVTGDARSNYHDPNIGALREISEQAGALFWLNPERRTYWDTGDSVISEYAAVCDGVFEVRNLRHLEAFVEGIALPSFRPVRRPA